MLVGVETALTSREGSSQGSPSATPRAAPYFRDEFWNDARVPCLSSGLRRTLRGTPRTPVRSREARQALLPSEGQRRGSRGGGPCVFGRHLCDHAAPPRGTAGDPAASASGRGEPRGGRLAGSGGRGRGHGDNSAEQPGSSAARPTHFSRRRKRPHRPLGGGPRFPRTPSWASRESLTFFKNK